MRSYRKIWMLFSVVVLILSILSTVSFSESINIPSVSEASDEELQEAINIILSEQKSRIKSSLSFANQNEAVSKGKTIKLVASAYDLPEDAKELSCTWESSDTSIASVKDGTVKGIDAGKATIKCVKTYSDGLELEASCIISVEVPIKKLSLPKSLTLGVNKSAIINVDYTPQNATNTEFEFITSDNKIANVSSKGKVTGVYPGSCTITVVSKDPEAAKASVKVNVKALSSEKTDYTITDKNGLSIDLQCWGSSSDKISISNESKKLFSVTGSEYSKASGKLTIHLSPIKAGKGKISIKDANSKESISLSITVDSSSVYDSKSYPHIDYKSALRDPNKYIGSKVSFTGEVLQYIGEDSDGFRQYLVYSRKKSYGFYDDLVLVIENSKGGATLIQDDIVTVYGYLFGNYTYSTAGNYANTVPIVYAEKYVIE